MKKSDFEEIYDIKENEFELAIGILDQNLKEGLKYFNLDNDKGGLFRLKYETARLKKLDTLFDKINNDESLSFEHAFDPGHVRDLIGARFICHNLVDVIKIGAAIKQGKWPGLEYRQRGSSNKRWLGESHPESGYRGWHLDVAWEAGGEEYFAELQIRTLLQDAWASFMHDDIYKSRATNVLPESIMKHLNRFSDMLHVIDEMADDLRREMEDLRATGRSGLKILEALDHAMYALNDWSESGFDIPEYSTVYRKDRYDIKATGDGLFTFIVEGECRQPSYFRFPVWGDTHHSNAEIVQLCIYEDDSWDELDLNSDDIDVVNPTDRSYYISHNDKKRDTHQYKVTIRWDGVFANDLEYIFAPWSNLYSKANTIDYDIKVVFDQDLLDNGGFEPFLVDMDEMDESIEELLYRASLHNHDGITLDRVFRGDKVVFSYSINDLNNNLLCLFDVL